MLAGEVIVVLQEIRAADAPSSTEGTAIYSGTVDITEALGEVTQIYFRAENGAAPVIAKLPGIHAGLRHKTVAMTADPAKVHLFHDGRSLLYR